MEITKSLKVLSAMVALVSISACANLKYDADRVKNTKRVALILEIQQQQPKDAFGFSRAGEINGISLSETREIQGMAWAIYKDAADQLSAKIGWQVMPLDKMMANAAYKKLVLEKMSGAHLTSMVVANSVLIHPLGMLDSTAYRSLDQNQRAQLAKALGVDAFAEVTIMQSIHQGWGLGNLTGDSPFIYQARTNLRVMGNDSDKVMIQIQNVDGAETEKSDTLPANLSKNAKLAKLGEDSAQTSMAKLVENIPK